MSLLNLLQINCPTWIDYLRHFTKANLVFCKISNIHFNLHSFKKCCVFLLCSCFCRERFLFEVSRELKGYFRVICGVFEHDDLYKQFSFAYLFLKIATKPTSIFSKRTQPFFLFLSLNYP